MTHFLIIWRHYDGNVDVHRVTTESPRLIGWIEASRGNWIDDDTSQDQEQDLATRELEKFLEDRAACLSTNDGGGRPLEIKGPVEVVMTGRCL